MRDPLPGWREGPAKATILDFVQRVTSPGADFVAPADRIATFDNDGTLWCEKPMQPQLYFALERLDALAAKDPSLRDRPPFKAFLERDLEAIKAQGKAGVLEFAAFVHSGTTQDAFDALVADWLATGRNPKLGRRFIDSVYQPQIELLAYLKANGFACFIVSGGGLDVMRGFSEPVYGIPKHHVVGSSQKTKLEQGKGTSELMKLSELLSFDDREEKVVNIQLHIGRRPILVGGNSDGDLAMMRHALAGPLPSLALLLHHDDAAREFAYDRDFVLSPLSEGLDKASEYGIRLVSMEKDWATVFPATA